MRRVSTNLRLPPFPGYHQDYSVSTLADEALLVPQAAWNRKVQKAFIMQADSVVAFHRNSHVWSNFRNDEG